MCIRDRVTAELQARTAEQMFKVLGELKGGAMKLGQMLSVFEAALPEEMAGPYRATLTRLQDAAPPMPAQTVHDVLADQLGADWRERFAQFDDDPAARALVIELAAGLGFDAVDLGHLAAARYLEPLAMVWIEMAFRLGHGRGFGFVRQSAPPR